VMLTIKAGRRAKWCYARRWGFGACEFEADTVRAHLKPFCRIRRCEAWGNFASSSSRAAFRFIYGFPRVAENRTNEISCVRADKRVSS